MAKDRKITEEDKTFYRLGYLNGESKSDRMIALLQKVNGLLADEIKWLDRKEPRIGVFLDYKTVEQVIKLAYGRGQNPYLARRLKEMRDKARARDAHTVLMAIEQVKSS